MKEEIEKIKKVTLTKKQSTKIFQKILDEYDFIKKDSSYSAPEVIEQRMKRFFWSIYVAGRYDEKNDIIKSINDIAQATKSD